MGYGRSAQPSHLTQQLIWVVLGILTFSSAHASNITMHLDEDTLNRAVATISASGEGYAIMTFELASCVKCRSIAYVHAELGPVWSPETGPLQMQSLWEKVLSTRGQQDEEIPTPPGAIGSESGVGQDCNLWVICSDEEDPDQPWVEDYLAGIPGFSGPVCEYWELQGGRCPEVTGAFGAPWKWSLLNPSVSLSESDGIRLHGTLAVEYKDEITHLPVELPVTVDIAPDTGNLRVRVSQSMVVNVTHEETSHDLGDVHLSKYFHLDEPLLPPPILSGQSQGNLVLTDLSVTPRDGKLVLEGNVSYQKP